MADSGQYDQATIARRQKIAEAMLSEGMKPRKIEHWAQGLAQLGQAGIGGYMSHLANEDAKASKAAELAPIAKLLGISQPSAATTTSATPAPAAAPASPAPSGDYSSAIAGIESGGAYDKLGPVTKGDRAYGKYQVMGANIPEWTAAATGRRMTPDEFLSNPEAQETVFKHRFGQYVDKYGPEGAAKAWFAGEKGMNNPNARDILGTTVADYGRKFMSAYAPTAPQAPVAQAMAPPQMPASQPGGGLLVNASPEEKAAIWAGMNASEGSPARAIATTMMSRLMKPQEFGFQTLPDGTIIRTDPRKGSVEPIYQAATKPTFGDTGEIDPQTGQPVKGFIDPSKRTVEPYRPKPTAEAQPSTIAPVPAGVDPKVWREAQSKRAAEEGMPADTKVVSALRNEVQGLPSYKNLAQAAPVYKSMNEAAGRDNRAADVNLIYGMAKIMDPGSVVRESEMTVAQAIATLPQQLQAALKSQMTEAGRLTPELRQMIMQEARSRILAYQGMFDQDANMYRGIAQRGRMNEADVLPTFGPFDEFKSPKTTAPVTIDGYTIKAK